MLQKSPIALALSLLWGICPLVAHAQQNAAAGSLSEVVVTADKIDNSARSAHEARHASANMKTVIDAEQLNQFGDQPLGDAMRRLVGVSFDGANRAREIQLRGIGVEYTQVTINGRRVLDGNSKRTVQVDRIPSSLVERIEIIHTPLASQDAQGAAGTVNIVLKQGVQGMPNEVGIGFGSLENNGPVGDATLFYTLGNEQVRLTLAGGIQQQRRNESKDTRTYSGSGAANGGTLATNERKYEQVNLTPRLDVKFDDRNTLVLEPTYLRTKEDRLDVKQTLAANQLSVSKKENELRERVRENKGIYGAWTHNLNSHTEFTTSVDWQTAVEDTAREAKTYNAAGALTGTRQRTENVGMDMLKTGFAARNKQGAHTLELGVGLAQEKRSEDNSDVKDGVLQPVVKNRRFQVQEDILSFYAQDTYKPFQGTQIIVGLRGERSDTQTTDFDGGAIERNKTDWLPSLSVKQALANNIDLRAGLAKTLRRPDMRELSPTVVQNAGTYTTPDVGGNPYATPESIWGLDVGIDYFFSNKQGILSAKTFARRFDNKLETITALESGRYVSRPQNVGDGKMHGVELEVRVPLAAFGIKDVTAWSNFTAVKTSVDVQQTGETRRFLDQPDYLANIGLDWFIPSWKTTLGASLNYASGYKQQYRLANGSLQSNDVASMTRLDLSARKQITRQTSIHFSALNMLARKEKRTDNTYTAAGVLTSSSSTVEPTYRTVYLRLSHMF